VADYAELATVKAALGKLTTDDRDELIQAAITSASRLIDARTGRRFSLDDAPSTRTFPVNGRSFFDGVAYQLLIDDLGATDGVTVETGAASSGTWTPNTSFEFGQLNAVSLGRPITSLSTTYGWGAGTTNVRVTGRWGWPAVPSEVALATQLLAARLYRRKDSPQGVIGSADWGAVRVSRVDPDVEALIAHLTLPGFA